MSPLDVPWNPSQDADALACGLCLQHENNGFYYLFFPMLFFETDVVLCPPGWRHGLDPTLPPEAASSRILPLGAVQTS